jgi:RHS repeat-associated protein
MTYDALGRMVEQNRSGAYTQFVYSPTGFKMQIMNGQAPPIKSLVPLPAGGQAIYSASGQYYYHPDHLGSSRFASTSSRTMYFDTAYAPFGEPYAQSGTADPSFTGQRQDTVAGLYDFPAREYSYQGRWPSPDPAGLAAVNPSNPQSWNRYAYVLNNPMALTDPTGLVCNGANQTMWDTLANGTGIFTQDDCIANGGTWQGPAAGTITTSPTYVTADPLPSPWAPWGPDLSGILSDSSGGGSSGKSSSTTIKSVLRKIGNYIPVVCGGGAFAYGGPRATGILASAGGYGIVAIDSRSGFSAGGFGDYTMGQGVQGGYGYARYTDGSTEHFLFAGVGQDIVFEKATAALYGSHVAGDSWLRNQFGLNVDGGIGGPIGLGGGLGLGVNTDSLTSCVDHHFH